MHGRRAFSLLEVLFAVALFGAVVTFILSAQAGLVAGNRTAANMSQAVDLARCKMSEIEERELKLGYPEVEEKDSALACCMDREVTGFSCDWKIERVKLPEIQNLGGDAGTNSLGGGLGLGLEGGIGSGLGGAVPSPAGTILNNPLGTASLDFDAGLMGMGGSLLQQTTGGAGAAGLLSMVFGMVYPSLKPLLEAAIRRVTITVTWKEGITKREFVLTQYITNPSRAGLIASLGIGDGGVLGGGEGGAGGLGGLLQGLGGMGGLGGLGGSH
jgi:general secretion pathway protein I